MPGTVQAALLMTPRRRHVAELCSPFRSVSFPSGAAFQLPVGNQLAWLVFLQPRLHGALMSPAHTRFGHATVNWRSRVFSATGNRW